jgi:hypothetical protein
MSLRITNKWGHVKKSGHVLVTCPHLLFVSFLTLAILILPVTAHAKSSKPRFVDLQAARKTRVTGWVFKQDTGASKMMRAIEVRFKLEGKDYVEVPIFKVYLYDKKKNMVGKLEDFLINHGMNFSEPADRSFKAKITHRISFYYPNERRFKYYLVVAGTEESLSVFLRPKTGVIKDFRFDERDLLRKKK